MTAELSLANLKVGDSARILRLEGPEPLVRRLMEMGVIEDAEVEVKHQAPFGGDLIAVQIRGALVAMRRQEAAHVLLSEASVRR